MTDKLHMIEGKNNIVDSSDVIEIIQNANITHGVVIFQTEDGSIKFATFDDINSTYLVGMIEKAKNAILEGRHG